jgi:hypothetical protein
MYLGHNIPGVVYELLSGFKISIALIEKRLAVDRKVLRRWSKGRRACQESQVRFVYLP